MRRVNEALVVLVVQVVTVTCQQYDLSGFTLVTDTLIERSVESQIRLDNLIEGK